MISPARVAAYQIGRATAAERSTLSDALVAERGKLTDDRDKALAAEIAIGVQRWRGAIDHLIVRISKRATDDLDAEVLEILRLSVYQLLRLTRVPASAVVDDAVKLTGWAGKRSASGLVNAVLRTMSRNRHRVGFPLGTGGSRPDGMTPRSEQKSREPAQSSASVLPVRPADPADRDAALDYLAITLSHPRWLVERWYTRYGFEATERWLLFNNTAAPLTLRANRLEHTVDEVIGRLESEHITVTRGRWGPDALVVPDGKTLNARDVEDGWYVVQDEASQLVALLAGVEPGPRVLDTCAAPGGKTTAIAARMPRGGLVVACDVRQRRVQLLTRTVRSARATNTRVVQADVMQPLPFHRSFDSVLVDAPCSGLGTLRRDPDIKWRRRENDVINLAADELAMLRHAAAQVRIGGRLIYATCSSEPEENESVVAAFGAAAPEFLKLDAREAAPDLPAALVDEDGHLRTYPHLHQLEAFFGAVFARTGT
jgi:16S rRNA (cytosine967-C5)-methyltransferase